ncbi:MAG: hypothetical protein AAFY76_05825, partial [Cyanobacteria bacterium J06649_11]
AGLKLKLGFIDEGHMLLSYIAANHLFTPNCQCLQYSFSQAELFYAKFYALERKHFNSKIINSALCFSQNKFDSMLFYYEDLNTIFYNITLFLAQLVQHRQISQVINA